MTRTRHKQTRAACSHTRAPPTPPIPPVHDLQHLVRARDRVVQVRDSALQRVNLRLEGGRDRAAHAVQEGLHDACARGGLTHTQHGASGE